MTPIAVTVDFDLVCPWCFIGKRHLDLALERFRTLYPRAAVDVTWRSVQLVPDVPPEGIDFATFYEARLGSVAAMRVRQGQVQDAAARAEITIDYSRIRLFPNSGAAHRLLAHVRDLGDPLLFETLLEGLFLAFFQFGTDIGDTAELVDLATAIGVPPDGLQAAIEDGRIDWRHSAVSAPVFRIGGIGVVSGAQPPEVLFLELERAMRQARQVAGVTA